MLGVHIWIVELRMERIGERMEGQMGTKGSEVERVERGIASSGRLCVSWDFALSSQRFPTLKSWFMAMKTLAKFFDVAVTVAGSVIEAREGGGII